MSFFIFGIFTILFLMKGIFFHNATEFVTYETILFTIFTLNKIETYRLSFEYCASKISSNRSSGLKVSKVTEYLALN